MEATTRQTPEREISRGVVALYKEFTGRGPTGGKTTIGEDFVLVVLQDLMLPAETTLVAEGRGATVRQIRRDFQFSMSDRMKEIVEKTTGRSVVCLLSDHSPDPDYACEVFVLEPLVDRDGDAPVSQA